MNINDLRKIWDSTSNQEGEFLLKELEIVGEEWTNLLKEKLEINPADKVLDIGCGVGFLSVVCQKNFF